MRKAGAIQNCLFAHTGWGHRAGLVGANGRAAKSRRLSCLQESQQELRGYTEVCEGRGYSPQLAAGMCALTSNRARLRESQFMSVGKRSRRQ